MTNDTPYDEIEFELDRLERIVLGELPDDDDDWYDVDLEANL